MSNLYRLVGVGNAELVNGLSKLVQQSNALTAQVLAHLVELDERRLHLELGFASLFAYCVEGLGMSEGTAGRRVTAARVCRRFPSAFERVARSELHLCALCALAPHLNELNSAELFEACKGKTRRQIEELLAMRFPRPDVREQIRRLPRRDQMLTRGGITEGAHGPAEQTAPPSRPFDVGFDPRDRGISLEVDAQRGAESAATGRPETPVIVANSTQLNGAHPGHRGRVEPMPQSFVIGGSTPVVPDARPRPRARELEPLSPDRFGVHFTADAELRDLIERARALTSHRIPNGELASLMKLMVASFVEREEKRRFGIGARPRRPDSKARPSRTSEPAAPPGGVPVPSCTSEDKACSAQATPPGPDRQANPSYQSKRAAPPGAAVTSKQIAPPGAAKLAPPPGGAAVTSTASEARIRAARPTPPDPSARSRYVPVQVRRETHARDGGRCAFVSPDGRRCNARAFIQFDHLEPFAWRGASDTSNLRLLCKAHNLLHARRCFGKLHIAAKIAAGRHGHSGPRPR